MIQGKATLVVDLGNSSTKGLVLFNKDPNTGIFRERRFDLSNKFAYVTSDYTVPDEYSPETSTMFSIDAEVDGAPVKGTFINGEVQEKELPSGALRPTATRKKYKLDTTALSLELSFLYGFKAIMAMERVSDFSQLDITWNVVTMLPPGDMDNGKDAVERIIRSIKMVTSTYPECNLEVKVDNTLVLPEGYCAYWGVVCTKGRKYRVDYKYLIDSSVIVFDVGAGTTDCMIVKKGKLIQSTRNTVNQGGNNVFQRVKKALLLKDLELDDNDIQEGIIHGYVKDGATKLNIVNIVNQAKTEVARIIIDDFIGFLEQTNVTVRSVGYVLICGGGSMSDSEVQEIKPLSESLVEYFKTLSPNSELVKIPHHTVKKPNEDGEYEKVEEQISPRDLNLIGASILAENL